MNKIITKRVYAEPVKEDGYRVLIDRLWPRGMSKAAAKLNEWNKEVAPSPELRKWFDHKQERFVGFAQRYQQELRSHQAELQRLKNITSEQQLCLVYGAKDEACNHALVLKTVLETLPTNPGE